MSSVFIGGHCSKMRVVPVPVRDCLQPNLRAIDAVFRLYVRTNASIESIVYDLDDYMCEVYDDECPPELRAPEGDEPYRYTIFTSDDVGLSLVIRFAHRRIFSYEA